MNTAQLEKTVYRIKPEIVILDSDDLMINLSAVDVAFTAFSFPKAAT